MKILGIETSCDETAAAVVEDGRKIISNVVSSSEAIHAKVGGVIPETAAREQLKYILPVIEEVTKDTDYEAIAVTEGPGLIGSLLIGVETAKALAYAKQLPLIPVNHLVGHIYANWLQHDTGGSIQDRVDQPLSPRSSLLDPELPAIALVASGAHSDIVLMKDHGVYEYLGGTRDDAAGEAFDKAARLLGLPYPGGPAIDREAKLGAPGKIQLPRPLQDEDTYDFSFSGLKTALRQTVQDLGFRMQESGVKPLDPRSSILAPNRADIAAEVQEAITDVLVQKTIRAANRHRVNSILLGGGVVANSRLREKLRQRWPGKLSVPEVKFSTDNAAMIAAAAYFNQHPVDPLALQADSSLSLET